MGEYGIDKEEFEACSDDELAQYLTLADELETARRQKLALQFFAFLARSRTSSPSSSHTNSSPTKTIVSLRKRPPSGDKK